MKVIKFFASLLKFNNHLFAFPNEVRMNFAPSYHHFDLDLRKATPSILILILFVHLMKCEIIVNPIKVIGIFYLNLYPSPNLLLGQKTNFNYEGKWWNYKGAHSLFMNQNFNCYCISRTDEISVANFKLICILFSHYVSTRYHILLLT